MDFSVLRFSLPWKETSCMTCRCQNVSLLGGEGWGGCVMERSGGVSMGRWGDVSWGGGEMCLWGGGEMSMRRWGDVSMGR